MDDHQHCEYGLPLAWDANIHYITLKRKPASIMIMSKKYFKKLRAAPTSPISLHSHVTDGVNPYVMASVILPLESYIPPEDSNKSAYDAFKLGEKRRSSPNMAIMEGCYGAGSGAVGMECFMPLVTQCSVCALLHSLHDLNSHSQRYLLLALPRRSLANLPSAEVESILTSHPTHPFSILTSLTIRRLSTICSLASRKRSMIITIVALA